VEVGAEGLATYRPNSVLGSVLSTEPAKTAEAAAEMPGEVMNRRLSIKTLPEPVLASLRWPGRPELPEGNPAWTFMIDSPRASSRSSSGTWKARRTAPSRSRCG